MGHSLSKFGKKNTVTEPAGTAAEQKIQKTMTEAMPVSTENQTSLQSNRDFHTNETSTYWLPKDDEEQLRIAGVSSYCSDILTFRL
jgi:hypothetical protein